MPPSEATTAEEKRAVVRAQQQQQQQQQQMGGPVGPVDQDHHQHAVIPCPRCESSNTKFCYYNNYNFSQPRHFCKSCRRYWTHGGTLRDIPIGGGSRKSTPAPNKRPRTSSGSSSIAAAGSQPPLLDPLPRAPPLFMSVSSSASAINGGTGGVLGSSSFTSLLSSSSSSSTNSAGNLDILALGGFGIGIGIGIEDAGFSLGRAAGIWTFPDQVGYVRGGINGTSSGGGLGIANGGDGSDDADHVSGGHTWQPVESGETGFGVMINGDCFPPLPDLAISTPGNRLK